MGRRKAKQPNAVVPTALKVKVEAKVSEGITQLEKHYNVKLARPVILYTSQGGTAGSANRTELKFNARLLIENEKDMINETVPHELAHNACFTIYPEAFNPFGNDEAMGMLRMLKIRGGRRFKLPKREIHGWQWKEIMKVLGADPNGRLHHYDMTNVPRKFKTKYQYKCLGCNKIIDLGPKNHKRAVRDPSSIWHKGCGRGTGLMYVGYTKPNNKPVAIKSPTYTPPMPAPKRPKGETKFAKAYRLYEQYRFKYDRRAMINVFVQELGMTQAGASTYYYNCQKSYGA